MKLPKCLEKYRNKIESISDERTYGGENDDGYWVYLLPGWHFEGCHCVHEDNPSQCAKVMREVVKCNCSECV